MLRAYSPFLLIIIFLAMNAPYSYLIAQSLKRGPYIQSLSSNSVTLKWRSDIPISSKVRYGKHWDDLRLEIRQEALQTEHELRLVNLESNTKYYYSILNDKEYLTPRGAHYYFKTAPSNGETNSVRIWALGDAGTKDDYARSVRDGYLKFRDTTKTDMILLLGDNAYTSGLDEEYQKAIFEDMLEEELINTVVWPSLGNHDRHHINIAEQRGPYFDIFSLPKNGEVGGVPSGTEAYYSFDYSNIHFISLNSVEFDLNNSMLEWLTQDLANNNQTWTFVFFHHPPYTKGTHDSDSDYQLVEIRTHVVPILENYGVDLVLTGHSHAYERSFLIHGHYDKSDTFSETMIVNGGEGQSNRSGSYMKSSTKGTVYAVAGCSGSAYNATFGHPVMYTSRSELGSIALDIEGTKLDFYFLGINGQVLDNFSITKTVEQGKSPFISLSKPEKEEPYTLGEELQLEAIAYDTDGRIEQVGFYVNDSLYHLDRTFPYNTTWQIPKYGIFNIKAKAWDDHGNITTSSSKNIKSGYYQSCSKIKTASDDAEEGSKGKMLLNDLRLDLGRDTLSGKQQIGLRFGELQLPRFAEIQEAYIQFTAADEAFINPCVLKIYVEANGRTGSFSNLEFDISDRDRISQSLKWIPVSWNTVNARSLEQRTPDLSSLVQELVYQRDFSASSSLTFLIEGKGFRSAYSYEGNPALSPELCIAYTLPNKTLPSNNSKEIILNQLQQFQLFPNPSKGDFKLQKPEDFEGELTLQLFDITGKSIFNEVFLFNERQTSQTFYLNYLSKGVYFMQLKIEGEQVFKKLILI